MKKGIYRIDDSVVTEATDSAQDTHLCDDGGMGVADLLGYRIEDE